ncbi:MAG: fumarylacetoacetate hydrolase family protein [Chloroflexi bacterium]|nr:fumarylacetoacetate hydrolase family protein [Chloroflexota bacterium]
MKLVYFNDFRLGVVSGESVVDVTGIVQEIPHVGPHDLISRLIERFDQYRARLEQAARAGGGTPLSQVRLRAPLPKPGKMLNMAGNYLENGSLKEPRPINGFLKSPNAVIGDGDTIALPDAPVTTFHHEAELGLVIGRKASKIRAADWRSYVFGCVNYIDTSARGLGAPNADNFFLGKSYHTFAPMGPYLVTLDEAGDPQNKPIQLWVDGELRQNYNTNDMGHKIPETLEWATSIATLNPGDILACGTNHQGLGPLQDGDKVEMEIPGLGRLHLNVTDAKKRSWPKGVDRETADRAAGRVRA